MKSLLIFFLVVLVATLKVEGKRCSPIICPSFEYDDNTTFDTLFLNYYLNESLPEDGSCLNGDQKHIIVGDQVGLPDKKRCVCVSSEVPDVFGVLSECCPGQQECPRLVEYYTKEKISDLYKRQGRLFIGLGITDGCCPKGLKKYYAETKHSGVDKRLCYCDPTKDEIIIHEGLPPADC